MSLSFPNGYTEPGVGEKEEEKRTLEGPTYHPWAGTSPCLRFCPRELEAPSYGDGRFWDQEFQYAAKLPIVGSFLAISYLGWKESRVFIRR